MVLAEELLYLVVYLIIIPILLFKMAGVSNTEFKHHAPGLIVYSVLMIIYKLQHMSEYIYLIANFLGDGINDKHVHNKIDKSYILYQIISPFHLLVPFVVVWWKRQEDIFMSFSKIDSLA